MTTIYLFHPFIEASETGNTVVGAFGVLWDGNASASSVIPHAMQGLESGFIFGSENIAGAGLHNIEAGIVG